MGTNALYGCLCIYSTKLKSPAGKPVKHHDDRIFSTAMAVNTLFYSWSEKNRLMPDTPIDVQEIIIEASEWLVAHTLSRKYKPRNAFFSGSVKSMTVWKKFSNHFLCLSLSSPLSTSLCLCLCLCLALSLSLSVFVSLCLCFSLSLSLSLSLSHTHTHTDTHTYSQLVSKLVGSSVCWSISWSMVHWSVGPLVGQSDVSRSVRQFVIVLVSWSVDWLVHRSVSWSVCPLAYWLVCQ